MTSAVAGGRQDGGRVPQKQTRVLKSCVSVTVTRGEGVNRSEYIAGVICTFPLAAKLASRPVLRPPQSEIALTNDLACRIV